MADTNELARKLAEEAERSRIEEMQATSERAADDLRQALPGDDVSSVARAMSQMAQVLPSVEEASPAVQTLAPFSQEALSRAEEERGHEIARAAAQSAAITDERLRATVQAVPSLPEYLHASKPQERLIEVIEELAAEVKRLSAAVERLAAKEHDEPPTG